MFHVKQPYINNRILKTRY